jgi:hypothetical protein
MITLTSNSREFLRQVEADQKAWASGAGEAVGNLLIDGMAIAQEEGFAPAPGPTKVSGGYKFYPAGGSMNVANSKGRMVFASGKIVDRGGKLRADLDPITLAVNVSGDEIASGTNSAGSRIVVTKGTGYIKARLTLPEAHSLPWAVFDKGIGAGATDRINVDGEKTPDQKTGQRRILRRAFAIVMKGWKQAMKGKMDKWMRRNFK